MCVCLWAMRIPSLKIKPPLGQFEHKVEGGLQDVETWLSPSCCRWPQLCPLLHVQGRLWWPRGPFRLSASRRNWLAPSVLMMKAAPLWSLVHKEARSRECFTAKRWWDWSGESTVYSYSFMVISCPKGDTRKKFLLLFTKITISTSTYVFFFLVLDKQISLFGVCQSFPTPLFFLWTHSLVQCFTDTIGILTIGTSWVGLGPRSSQLLDTAHAVARDPCFEQQRSPRGEFVSSWTLQTALLWLCWIEVFQAQCS